jgi:hypothetical protein
MYQKASTARAAILHMSQCQLVCGVEDGLEAHVGICLDNSVAHVKQRFDAMRHQDELVKAYRTLQMEAALKRQQADEGQIKSPPSLFRAAARDFQATRPIDAKGE